MKNPIDSAMFIDSFDFLTKEYNFIRKGTLFIRLVNNEMIHFFGQFAKQHNHHDSGSRC